MNNIFFTSDWHFNHGNILKYCGRTEFMTSDELANYNECLAKGDTRMKGWRVSAKSIERMNNAIIDGINDKVKEYDELWCLGDVFMGKSLGSFQGIRKRINCRNINLILGNHDKNISEAWKRFRDCAKNTNTKYNMIGQLESIVDGLILGTMSINEAIRQRDKISTHNSLSNLFSQIAEVAVVTVNGQGIFLSHYAHAVWNKSHHGRWHLYGHSHGNFEKFRENTFGNAKMLDVGIDYRNSLGRGYTPWSFQELEQWMRFRNGMSVDHHGGDD